MASLSHRPTVSGGAAGRAEQRPGPTLGHQPPVIGAVVLGVEPRHDGLRPGDESAVVVGEPIGQREQQHDQRLSILGLRRQDVLADALRLLGFVQQPVALGLGERGGNGDDDRGFNWNMAAPRVARGWRASFNL